MNQKKRHLASTLSGAVVGLFVATAVLQLGLPFSDGNPTANVAVLAAFGVVNGSLIAVLGSRLCHGFHKLEQCALVLLTSIGLAALSVILGPFAENSAVPAMLYGVALVNGLALGPVSRLLGSWLTVDNVRAT